jgi:hypothetical protein
LTGAACAAMAACSSPQEPHGSPILTQVYWVTGGSELLVWSRDPSVALVSPVSPFASELDFVFDRRLDGDNLEDLVTVGSVTSALPKDPPAVRVSWPDMAATSMNAPFTLVIDYNSAARFGANSSYVFARPAVPSRTSSAQRDATAAPGFPSMDTMTFALDSSRFTSAYGEPAVVPTTIPVKTSALSVSIGVGPAAVPSSFQVPLSFSNRLPAAPTTSPFIHLAANGGAVPYMLLADASLTSRWYLAAATCLGAWPAGTTFTVTIDAGLPDVFGGKLPQPVTATFVTGASASAPTDASCSIADGGVVDAVADGGAGDAVADGGAGDAGDGAAVDTASPVDGAGADAFSDASRGDSD